MREFRALCKIQKSLDSAPIFAIGFRERGKVIVVVILFCWFEVGFFDI